MHLSHIPQYTIEKKTSHMYVLNGVLLDIGQVHFDICGIGDIIQHRYRNVSTGRKYSNMGLKSDLLHKHGIHTQQLPQLYKNFAIFIGESFTLLLTRP